MKIRSFSGSLTATCSRYCLSWMVIASLVLLLPGAVFGANWQLVETIIDKYNDPSVQVANGSVSQTFSGCQGRVTWNMPGSMDDNGATITFTSQGQCSSSNLAISASISGTGGVAILDASGANVAGRELAGVFVNGPNGPKGAGLASAQVRIRPPQNAREGAMFELRPGWSFRPALTYRFRAMGAGGGMGGVGGATANPDAGRRLSARLECPAEITIGRLPSLNCHIQISGWRRNTATPMEVILPTELDTFGNHANGIQILGRGKEDVFNWAEPVRSWGVFVYACQAPNVGANCYSNVAVPGPKNVPILVRQGDQEVRLNLVINALAPPSGPAVGAGGAPPFLLGNSVNRPGFDYTNFVVSDARWETCQQACADDRLCLAFTFVKPGVQGPQARCWLKDRVPPEQPNDCCISGVKPASAESGGAPLVNFRVGNGENRPGSDYNSFNLNEPRWDMCQQACAADARCQAFTYVRPGVQGPQARCWLKDNVPPASQNDCCTSGVKNTGLMQRPR